MLPSVSPVVRSMSSGVWTSRNRMMSRMFGANSAMRSMTASPNASRWSSHVPSSGASLYGAYWTKQLMTCLPGGAMDGSTSVGMIMSMYGYSEKWPYLASS